jgi:hypothetical protein
MNLLALTVHNGIRVAEVGEALGAVGGGVLVLSVLVPLGRRNGTLIAGLCLAAGFVLLIVATRWGGFG